MEDPRGVPSAGSVTPDANDPVHGPIDWRSAVESESLYRSLVEQLPAAVYVDLFLPEHTKVYMSPIVEPMLGYPQASYYTDHDLWERSIHPEDQGWVLAAWEAAFQGDTPYDVEYRFLRADGTTVWLRDRAAPLRDADGVAIGWQGVMIDITAQKEAELALRLSEGQHRALIEHLPAISYVASDSPEGETLFESPNVEDILGYAPTSGGEWSGFVVEADQQRVMDGWKDAVGGDGPFDMEYRVVHADGRTVWIHDHGVLIRDPAGRRIHWQGVMVDISARVKAEQDLAVADTRYRALIEGIPAVVYEMGPDDERRTIYANPRVEQLLGYSREEWLDQPDIWIELLHPDDRETELAAHDRHSETGEAWSREYRMIAADGRIVWVHDQATLVRDERGNPLTWQGLMVDITAQKLADEQLRLSHDELEFRDLARTVQLEEANELMTLEIAERRRAERELRAAEERYRSLVEELPAVVYLWQPRIDDLSLAYANRHIERMLGYSPEEWNAGSWVDRVHPHDRDRVLAIALRSETTGEPFEASYRYLAKDGHVVWVIDRAVLLSRSEDGKPLVFQGVMIDVTAQREAERKADQAEARFRELAESGPFVPYSFEVDHAHEPAAVEVTYVSPQAAAILGLAPDVHRDQASWLTAVHPHDRDRFNAQAAENLATGGSWDFDYRTIDADGTVIWLNDRGSCIERDGRGRPVRFVGALSNVTRRREELDEVETERARLRTLADRIPGVPWSGSFDTVSGRYRLVFVGPQIRELLGIEAATLLADGGSLTRWIHPDDRAIVAASQRADRSDVEFRVVRRDGTIRWVHGISARETRPEENPHVWHGLMLDVTERHAGTEPAPRAEHAQR
jgi:PAS domain S-box-containing protein